MPDLLELFICSNLINLIPESIDKQQCLGIILALQKPPGHIPIINRLFPIKYIKEKLYITLVSHKTA